MRIVLFLFLTLVVFANPETARAEVVARLKAEIAEWDRSNVPAQWTSMRQAVRRHEGQMLKIYP